MKVIHILLFIFVLLFGEFLIFDTYQTFPMNYKKTRISCLNDEFQRYDIKKSDIGISGDHPVISNEMIDSISMKYCGKVPTDHFRPLNSVYLIDSSTFIASYGVMDSSVEWKPFISWSIVLIVSLLFISELIRRICYYIILGTLKPDR